MFDLRERLVTDFKQFIDSFLKIRDERIRAFIDEEMRHGVLSPEPLLQLNPTFAQAPLVDELVEQGVLHRSCGGIFRRAKSPEVPAGQPLRLFQHQVEAIHRAQAGKNYVLTTGTGSGKSLSYILPIVDAVLKEGPVHGVRAIIIYPMNALANSQLGELEKYLGKRTDRPAVTYARYTGQEGREERDRILKDPPAILLTNYMMAELMLTRPFEKPLVEATRNLRFVVLDELHTYRGRQGADVALLMRRLAQRSGSSGIQFVGTSATMASDGTAAEKRAAVADVATRLFGRPVGAEDVIGETLRPFTDRGAGEHQAVSAEELRAGLASPADSDREAFRAHPLTAWLEWEIGLRRDDENRLVRARPATIYGEGSVAEKLQQLTGAPIDTVTGALQVHLLTAAALEQDPQSGGRPFVFRLHQFFSPGIGLFASLAKGDDRFLTLEGLKADPANAEHVLFPVCFCRICGQHYNIVTRTEDSAGRDRLIPRRLSDTQPETGSTPGFLYIPDDGDSVDLDAIIPDDWREEHRGEQRVRRNRRDKVPTPLTVGEDGIVGGPLEAWFVPQPFTLCLNPECGASYEPRERSDIAKLSILGTQGRSTGTTILAVSALDFLRDTHEVADGARKLLSFTDNRQDASLQAGHLNDFVEVGVLRAAIYAAARSAGDDGVYFDQVTLAVERQLGLEQDDYAEQPSTLPTQIKQRRDALRDVLGYRIYRDLRRGWRINAPNLEQVGLLKVDYPDLPVVCAEEARWQNCHQSLVAASADVRESICRELLERMRAKLAIRIQYFDPEYQEGMRRRSSQLLKEPWGFSSDEAERLDTGAHAWLGTAGAKDDRPGLSITPRSAFGIWLRRASNWPGMEALLSTTDTEKLLEDLVRVLCEAAIIKEVAVTKRDTAYQVNAEALIWRASEPGPATRRYENKFFESFYREGASHLKGIHAREHTAQVPGEEREKREQAFRSGELPVLFCSPTMELGVDIADLNVVNMRNVPPTPANYAQRSGRAGRSGQPALVYTYCTAGSPHDQHYFRRPEDMVSGAVAPPRLDLANEDLVRAHVHAVWLGEAGLDLGHSLAEHLLDVAGESPSLELQQQTKDALYDTQAKDGARRRAHEMLAAVLDDLEQTKWFTPRWLDDVIDQIPLTFDRACERWRNLYRAADEQAITQAQRARLMVQDSAQAKTAKGMWLEALQQLKLLRDVQSDSISDFYSYRYFASEGFLPGYNFPRLPLSAYLPGHRGRDEYLSRPRFLAIAEFGPGAVVYHEGSRYLVERVLIPASARQPGGQLVTATAKICQSCAYVHSGESATTADVCDSCGKPLPGVAAISDLFRLEAVSLRRKDRITCDEEERMRQGYELRTAIRYAGRPGEEQVARADVQSSDGSAVARLTYSQATTIWRVNVGWNRRADKEMLGYMLDVEKAKWISEPGANSLMESESDEPGHKAARVVPYVEDRRNALLFEWASELPPDVQASLQAGLKTAIQTHFQLEDNELAAEPLPSQQDRRIILFYESAEGGAGVLRRLVDEPQTLRDVARKALELCHYDSNTLEDLGHAPRARENCSAACYDCLMSYGNQRDHLLLDRRLIRDLLAALRDGKVEAAPGSESRPKKLERLLAQCGSDLERRWLNYLEERKLNLPTHAQYRIAACGTVPDFAYTHGGAKLAVYIDGPPHDYPARQLRDQDRDMALMAAGWIAVRFHHRDDWERGIAEYPNVFGVAR